MKFSTPTKILFLITFLILSATGIFAQTKSQVSPTETNKTLPTKEIEKAEAEPMKEGDRLTFMEKTETTRIDQPESGSLFLKTLGAMFLIIGLVFFGAWSLKKLGFGKNSFSASSEDSPELTILATVSPKSGQTMSVVRFGERTLLVGSTAQSFTLLAEQRSFETDFGQEDSAPKHLSVAEMLAQEEISFDDELKKAENKLIYSGGQS